MCSDDPRPSGWPRPRARTAAEAGARRPPTEATQPDRQGKDRAAPDRLGRTLTADPVDQAWCGDVTFIRTVPDPMDPATVIDPYSRRCLGHATSAQHDQELRVVSLRRGQVELAEYVGSDHVKASRRLGLVQSVGRVASALDNAVAASFNITLKTEFVYRRTSPPGTAGSVRPLAVAPMRPAMRLWTACSEPPA